MSSSKPGSVEKKPAPHRGTPHQEFVCKLKYRNVMPQLPFDPKLLDYPFAADRHYKYQMCPIFDSHPQPLYAPDDFNSCPIDLLSSGFIRKALKGSQDTPEPTKLDPEDSFLLDKPVDVKKEGPARSGPPNVSWLRRTEYISMEASRGTGKRNEGVETKMGLSIMKDKEIQKFFDLSQEGQIKAIEQTFESVKRKSLTHIKHPVRSGVTATEIFPIYPDFMLWPNKYVHSVYDANPLSASIQLSGEKNADPVTKVRQEEVLLRPMIDLRTKGEFFSLYAPDDESAKRILKKRKRDNGEENDDDIFEDQDQDLEAPNDYGFIRDFEQKKIEEETGTKIFIVLRPDEGGAFYNVLDRKYVFRRKRNVRKSREDEADESRWTKVTVAKRRFTNEEKQRRMDTLEACVTKEHLNYFLKFGEGFEADDEEGDAE
ncbi:RNA polymerase II-associated [Polychytrium aggregatum]|uniref:RNA polymerase II-associated n=1 Tax=Polychytrium aggregatum TaxID=110093 RepID=UPI0022FDDDFD|nr:RNA polymerase II-associated [Polychytrium aggregatum]KAI9204435.1 RNA polymerase II-associated [Polychytrium aggregatum]